MSSDLDDLILFLGDQKLEVRKMAVDIVLGLSGSDDGIQHLGKRASDVGPALLQLLNGQQDIATAAGNALVNLSVERRIAVALIYGGAMERCLELVSSPQYTRKQSLLMLLANLTLMDEGANRLLQENDETRRGVHISKLVYFFSRSTDSDPGNDEFEHVASILVNVTRIKAGRRVLLDTNKSLLRQVLPQIESRSLVRQRGVAGTVRNCCFEASTSLSSLLLASQFLWPALLLPLAGSKPYSLEDRSRMPPELASPLAFERTVETDAQVRVEAAEALYLIAVQEPGRRALWAVNAPRIFQVGYEDEENPSVVEAYERLGSLFIRESLSDPDVEEKKGEETTTQEGSS